MAKQRELRFLSFIRNQDAKSEVYRSVEKLLRPGHANYTYLAKIRHF